MGMNAFFCYDRLLDIQRAKRVRHRYEMKGGKVMGFPKPDQWKKILARGNEAIRYWVEDQINFSDVTVVLIGANTHKDPVVRQAVTTCHQLEKGMLGIYIHGIRTDNGRTSPKGVNPFDCFCVVKGDQKTALSQIYHSYDWIQDAGQFNLNQWIQKAAQAAWNPFRHMAF